MSQRHYYSSIMASDRIQRRIERLLDEADGAFAERKWPDVQASAYLRAAERRVGGATPILQDSALDDSRTSSTPTSFANGRYEVKKFLGEGGKKKVYLAQDALLDREVAFALIKTEGLDDISHTRITREAQAMGRLGSHPHIVTVFDLGEHEGQPYMVTELMGGEVTPRFR